MRQASIAALALADWAASAVCPWDMNWMCSLKARASPSRSRLASTICRSASAASSLLVSWVLRTLIKCAALILLSTAISVFMLGIGRERVVFQVLDRGLDRRRVGTELSE